jgi:hypothetical protein
VEYSWTGLDRVFSVAQSGEKGAFRPVFANSWDPRVEPTRIYQTVSRKGVLRSPHPTLAPVQGCIAAYVARIRYERLQLTTAELPENFPLAPGPNALDWARRRGRGRADRHAIRDEGATNAHIVAVRFCSAGIRCPVASRLPLVTAT